MTPSDFVLFCFDDFDVLSLSARDIELFIDFNIKFRMNCIRCILWCSTNTLIIHWCWHRLLFHNSTVTIDMKQIYSVLRMTDDWFGPLLFLACPFVTSLYYYYIFLLFWLIIHSISWYIFKSKCFIVCFFFYFSQQIEFEWVLHVEVHSVLKNLHTLLEVRLLPVRLAHNSTRFFRFKQHTPYQWSIISNSKTCIM